VLHLAKRDSLVDLGRNACSVGNAVIELKLVRSGVDRRVAWLI
jgi:hypothetical protein